VNLHKYKISSNGKLSVQALELGLSDLDKLSDWLKTLKYKRTSSKEDLRLVFTEECGTCSSKHALFKSIVDENQFKEFKLIIGLFKMNHLNTSGIGNALSNTGLNYIPEAHCYIRTQLGVIDLTNPESFYSKVKEEIISEIEIEADQVGAFKVNYHKEEIRKWIEAKNIDYTVEEIWSVREQCILNLS